MHGVLVQMKWCRDITGYKCETVRLQPAKIFQKPEDSMEGTQRRECSRERRLLQMLNSDEAALGTC